MNLIENKTARRFCIKCDKLHWHTLPSFDVKLHIGLILVSFLTCGLGFIPYLIWFDYANSWKCKFCGYQDPYSLKTLRRLNQASTSVLPNEGSRPQNPYFNQEIPDSDLYEDYDEDYATEDNSRPPQPFVKPAKRKGKMSNSSAWKNRPPNMSHKEYWAWHDTLYLGGSFRSKEWSERAREAKRRDGRRCVECGATESLETDHIIELSRGGSNDFENLQTLCHSCHQIKTKLNRKKQFRGGMRNKWDY